ncbi:hypothetical protein HK101_009280 [Irineochytrium annulatum]|nr:hypothetical protein HK101_009280 [Irineochytrium annulatum]
MAPRAQILSVSEVRRASLRSRAPRVAAAVDRTSDRNGNNGGDGDDGSEYVGDDEQLADHVADVDLDGAAFDRDEPVTTKKRRSTSDRPSTGARRRRPNNTTPPATPSQTRSPDAPAPGSVAISAKTLTFLRDLAVNNDKEWFNSRPNHSRYVAVKNDFEIFVSYLKDRIRELDPALPDAPAKSFMFSATNDTSHPACFYFRVEPGKSRIGGGLYDPDGGRLAACRRAMVADGGAAVRAVVEKDSFRGMFGDKPLQATVEGAPYNKGLKTAPKGYKRDHDLIELLKLRDYGVMREISDEVVEGEDFMDVIMLTWTELMPWIMLLNTYAS